MVETAQLESPVSESRTSQPESRRGPARILSGRIPGPGDGPYACASGCACPEVARSFPHSPIWALIAYNTEHVEWQGCSLHDLIQPVLFSGGSGAPIFHREPQVKGQSFKQMLAHAIRRAFILIFLGIFLRSLRSRQTYFTFEDTLTQIGLGYVFLFLLGFTRVRTQVVRFMLILICFWAAFAIYPAPGPQFDYTRVGVPQNWAHNYTGFLSHWNKNSNLSWAFDVWFLNLFPREHPFVFNEGGWSTLSFIPNARHHDPGTSCRRMA